MEVLMEDSDFQNLTERQENNKKTKTLQNS